MFTSKEAPRALIKIFNLESRVFSAKHPTLQNSKGQKLCAVTLTKELVKKT